jgi:cobalamin synthase
MAFQVLGLALWGTVGVIGAWLLVTGRHVFFGLTIGPREGWQLRVLGLAYLVGGAFLAYRAAQGSFSPEGIVFSYVALGLVVWTAWRRWRLTHLGGHTGESEREIPEAERA